jgi:hypothetical protein
MTDGIPLDEHYVKQAPFDILEILRYIISPIGTLVFGELPRFGKSNESRLLSVEPFSLIFVNDHSPARIAICLQLVISPAYNLASTFFLHCV